MPGERPPYRNGPWEWPTETQAALFEADAERTVVFPRVKRRSRWRHRVGQPLVAVLSALVLLVTGYAWVSLPDLSGGADTGGITAGAGPDGSLDILLVGRDSRTDSQGNPLPGRVLDRLRAGDNDADLTDTLILLHIPKDRSRAVAYSLPRDSYVSIPDGHGEHKINSAFGRGRAAATEQLRAEGVSDPTELRQRSANAGRQLLTRTVEDLTGLGIDRYAEVNLLGFYRITKAVGGVEVCLNEPVEDPASGADFPAGRQTISGADALAFVRQRMGLPRGDLDRVVRQQAFLAGLARSVLNGGTLTNPAQLNELFDSLRQSVVLSEGWDVLAFAQQMQGLAAGNIRFDTIPVENPAYDTPDGEAVQVDPARVQEALRDATGKRPTRPQPPPEPPDLSAATVNVHNTTSHTDLASRVLDDLAQDGIPVGTAANADPEPSSTVHYAPGNGDAARYVASHLDDMPVERDPALDNGDIDVLLGDDYDGPALQGFGAPPLLNLDGAPSPRAQQEPDDRDGPIGADGVPCIN